MKLDKNNIVLTLITVTIISIIAWAFWVRSTAPCEQLENLRLSDMPGRCWAYYGIK